MEKRTIFFGNPDQLSPVIERHIADAQRHGASMLCIKQEDGSVKVDVMSPADFYAQVWQDITPEQKKFLESCLSRDFGKLEERAIALAISGRRATMMIADDLLGDMSIPLVEPEEEQSVQVGNRLVAPNKRTKGKAHALPFYLGNKRF